MIKENSIPLKHFKVDFVEWNVLNVKYTLI